MKMEDKNQQPGTISYSARYRQIISIFASYGFHDLSGKIRSKVSFTAKRKKRAASEIPQYNPCGIDNAVKKQKQNIGSLNHYQRVRYMLEELGPAFIKFGQLLSGRPDLIDPNLAKELEKLQDGVLPFPGEEAERIIELELGKPIQTLFASFDRTPIASASIAQVHRAMLHNGTPAAVKVRRPGIENIISVDIRILKDLAQFSQKHIAYLSYFQPVSLIDIFSRGLTKELDFTHEMDNLRRFTENYKNSRHLRIPRYYPQLSSDNVFVMEFIIGIKISCIRDSPAHLSVKKKKHADSPLHLKKMPGTAHRAGYNPEVIADRFVTLVLDQIFHTGYFHGDPHPGNIMVMPDNDICFLDFGIMGALTSQQKESLSKMLIAIPSRNIQRFTRALLSLLGINHIDRFDVLAQECGSLIEKYLGGTLEDIELGSLINDMMKVIISFNILIPPGITLMAKSMTAIEAVALQLNPRFNILEKITPFIKQLAMERFSPKEVLKHNISTALAYSEFFQNIPENTMELYNLVSSGNMTLKLDISEMDKTINTFDTIANRLVFGMVTAALLISSSIIVFAKIPPLWNNLSLIGVAGFLFSAFMGFVFVIIQFIRMFKKK